MKEMNSKAHVMLKNEALPNLVLHSQFLKLSGLGARLRASLLSISEFWTARRLLASCMKNHAKTSEWLDNVSTVYDITWILNYKEAYEERCDISQKSVHMFMLIYMALSRLTASCLLSETPVRDKVHTQLQTWLLSGGTVKKNKFSSML